jgi:ribosomal protein S18 acetylase RimI-like enzyme
MDSLSVREVTTGKGELCAAVLADLPHWFGFPEANAAYAADVELMFVIGAFIGDQPVGFLALHQHTPHASELHVMGVLTDHHHRGIGRALVEAAAAHARAAGTRFLTVKTLSSSQRDEGYKRTRAFYRAVGFVEIEEFPTLWEPGNPAVMMLRAL